MIIIYILSMSRAGNFFSNKIKLNNFWFMKLDIFYSKMMFFLNLFLMNLKKELFKKNIFLVNNCFKFYSGYFYMFLNIILLNNYKLNKKIKKINFYLFSYNLLNMNIFKYNFLFFFIFKNNLNFLFFIMIYFLNKLKKNKNISIFFFKNKLKLNLLNKLKLNLLMNLIKIKFINKFNFNLFKFFISNFNSKFLNTLKYKKKLMNKYNYLYNISKIVLLFNYCMILKNFKLIFNYIFFLFSSKMKNHYKTFKLISKILLILFKNNFIKVNGIKLLLKGKMNGESSKKKLIFNVGKLNFSKFNNYLSYNFLTSLTIFGSISFKLWIMYD